MSTVKYFNTYNMITKNTSKNGYLRRVKIFTSYSNTMSHVTYITPQGISHKQLIFLLEQKILYLLPNLKQLELLKYYPYLIWIERVSFFYAPCMIHSYYID